MSEMTLSKAEYSKTLKRVWILGFVVLLIIIGSVNCFRLFGLYRDGVTTEATVRSIEPGYYRTIKYSYVVNGVSYDGEAHEGVIKFFSHPIQEGDRLPGFYKMDDISVSCLGDPGWQLAQEAAFALLAAILMPSLIVFRARRRFDLWLKRNSPPNSK